MKVNIIIGQSFGDRKRKPRRKPNLTTTTPAYCTHNKKRKRHAATFTTLVPDSKELSMQYAMRLYDEQRKIDYMERLKAHMMKSRSGPKDEYESEDWTKNEK